MGLAAAAGLGLDYLNGVFNRQQLLRRTPVTRPAGDALQALGNGLEKRIDDIGSGRKLNAVDLKTNVPPEGISPFNPMVNVNDYAGNKINPDTGNHAIAINPNVDEAYLAHELGHIASRHTDIGELVRTLRDNPKLRNVLLASAATTPFLAAALEPGDNDLDTSIALASVSALPTLIDEGLATKNGLAIMDLAGRRASLGQRGKMAAGFMSYLAPAIVAGAGGNYLGNLVDSDPSGL